jgi:RNA polymerase sigma-70 factor (ECF subfamily)
MLDTEEERGKLEQLYNEYKQLMMQIAVKILRNNEDAEDAVQSAFVKLARHLEKVEEICSPKTRRFMIILIRSVSLDLYRQLRSAKTVLYNDDFVENARDEEFPVTFVLNAEYNALYEALATLPDPARDILALYYVEQYSVGEIASILDLTDSTVKKRLQRARGTLRVRLQESESVYA